MLSRVLAICLLAGGSARCEDPVQLAPDKIDRSLVVNLRTPMNQEFAKDFELLGKVKERGATHWTLRATKDEEASAEIVVRSQVPAKLIAAVTQELLQGGIKKITIEVTK